MLENSRKIAYCICIAVEKLLFPTQDSLLSQEKVQQNAAITILNRLVPRLTYTHA